jgi:hypothetical protein
MVTSKIRLDEVVEKGFQALVDETTQLTVTKCPNDLAKRALIVQC